MWPEDHGLTTSDIRDHWKSVLETPDQVYRRDVESNTHSDLSGTMGLVKSFTSQTEVGGGTQLQRRGLGTEPD